MKKSVRICAAIVTLLIQACAVAPNPVRQDAAVFPNQPVAVVLNKGTAIGKCFRAGKGSPTSCPEEILRAMGSPEMQVETDKTKAYDYGFRGGNGEGLGKELTAYVAGASAYEAVTVGTVTAKWKDGRDIPPLKDPSRSICMISEASDVVSVITTEIIGCYRTGNKIDSNVKVPIVFDAKAYLSTGSQVGGPQGFSFQSINGQGDMNPHCDAPVVISAVTEPLSQICKERLIHGITNSSVRDSDISNIINTLFNISESSVLANKAITSNQTNLVDVQGQLNTLRDKITTLQGAVEKLSSETGSVAAACVPIDGKQC